MDEDQPAVAVEIVEGDAPPEPQAVEALAEAAEHADDAAIDIARIEAGRDVQIAEIQAETDINRSENLREDIAIAIIARIEGLEEWRDQHGPPDHPAIWAALTEVQTMLLSISERLTPPPPPEPSHENPPEDPPSSEEGGEDGSGPTSSEPMPASEQEKPASGARRVRWI